MRGTPNSERTTSRLLGDPRLEERQMADAVAGKLGIASAGHHPRRPSLTGARSRRRSIAMKCRSGTCKECPIHLLDAPRSRGWGRYPALRRQRRPARRGGHGPVSLDRCRRPFLSRVPDNVFRIARKAVYSASGLSMANPFFAINLGIGLHLVDGGARARPVERVRQTYEFLNDPHERRIHVMRLCDNSLFLPRFFQQGDRFCMGSPNIEYCDAAGRGALHVASPKPADRSNIPQE